MYLIGLVTGRRHFDPAHAVSLWRSRVCKLRAAHCAKDNVSRSLTPDGRGKAYRRRQLMNGRLSFYAPTIETQKKIWDIG